MSEHAVRCISCLGWFTPRPTISTATWARARSSSSQGHSAQRGRGGGDNDPGNLVCACWVCNSVKGDLTLEQLGWELLPISDDTGWDGLTRYYAALWRLADEPPGHATWVRLFG